MSGYKLIIRQLESVLISDKPPIKLHWNNTTAYIRTFTNLNTNACDQKKLMLRLFLSRLQLLILNIIFVSVICISEGHLCFSKWRSLAVNEIFVCMCTHLSNRLICSSAMARILQFTVFIPAKTMGRVMKFVTHILQLILFYNIFSSNLHLLISN